MATAASQGALLAPYGAGVLMATMAAPVVTGAVASDAPAGSIARLVVVAFAYVGTYACLWLATFAVYQRVLFRTSPDGAAGMPPLEADGEPEASSYVPVHR